MNIAILLCKSRVTAMDATSVSPVLVPAPSDGFVAAQPGSVCCSGQWDVGGAAREAVDRRRSPARHRTLIPGRTRAGAAARVAHPRAIGGCRGATNRGRLPVCTGR